ncbi:MAG: peptidylprolyl isomerase [Planctomycetota bacterium]
MIRPLAPTLLALPLLLALPAAAQPAPPPPETAPFKVELSLAKAKLTLGENVSLKVKVTNTAATPQKARKIAYSTHSVIFELSGKRWGTEGKGPPRYVGRFPGGISSLKPQPQEDLAPGASFEGELELPTIEVGQVTVKAVYTGFVPHPRQAKRSPPPVFSEPVTYEVVPTAEGGKYAVARMETNHGTIRLRFYDEVAPGHVRNFVALAKAGFYKGLTFHRVIKDFMIQGGDPEGTGNGGPGWSIPAEFSRALRHHPGTLAAARTNVPHSAGSQFYICLGSPSHLDGQYTVFGQVYAGQEAVNAIGALPTTQDKPNTPATIKDVTIEYVAEQPKTP